MPRLHVMGQEVSTQAGAMLLFLSDPAHLGRGNALIASAIPSLSELEEPKGSLQGTLPIHKTVLKLGEAIYRYGDRQYNRKIKHLRKLMKDHKVDIYSREIA